MKSPPIIFFAFILHLSVSCAQRQVYIVYFGEHNGEKTLREIEDTHYSYLVSVKDSKEEAKASLIYSYKNIINGFSALLTPAEAAKLLEMDEVVSVFHSHPRKYSVQTTRSWDFVNLLDGIGDMNHSNQEELLIKASYGKEAIVGLLDTGIWPESQSFSDEGMEPIPKSWKGICQHGVAFNSSHCNRKLIGARYYLKGYEAIYGPLKNQENYRSPRDKSGHGTHTASTVGGRRVANASALGGFANGTASGGAPLVRIAMYKVCWKIPGQDQGGACLDDDMLAAFDDAIADGVQVLSVSIVSFNSTPYTEDVIAIGSLHAVKRNIVVACSAGNSGPLSSTVTNVAPWIITVAASSIDRVFTSPVLLGNDMKLEGQTITPYKLKKLCPLVYAGDAEIPGTTTNATTGRCLNGTLSSKVVEGKIVLCLGGKRNDILKGLEVRRAGGAAIIAVNPINGRGILVNTHLLPGTTIFSNDSATVLNYINNTKSPMATITPAKTVLGSKPAPFMAPFSSLGPNGIEPNILKPDITAPGLNILAAWSEASSPTSLSADHRVTKYNILSGTSMSCPHVAAAAALLKAIHPDWSSAAIRSALMTTENAGVAQRSTPRPCSGRPAFFTNRLPPSPIPASQVYVVYVGEHSGEKTLHEIEESHHSYLLSVKNSKEEAKASLIYSYKKIINGFSALLTPDEAAKLSEMDEVVSVFQSHPRRYSLQTTRSWDFVNLLEGGDLNHTNREKELLQKANYGKDVIVGLLDSGVWPESESFSDEGMEPVPESWKGVCQNGVAFNQSHCNRKIIGARYYLKGYEAYYGTLNNTEDYRSPRDKDGHGTHTTSTVGGRIVPNASVLGGFAKGTASSGAPLVRLAIYKVCWPVPGQPKVQGNTCFGEDMLAAFDDAIADGVHVLSISIVPFDLSPYTEDAIALGSLHAVKRNIVVACSAGNTGPAPSTVGNVAPWIITVGASSIDRIFSSPVLLGNGMKIEGQTITPYKLNKMYSLVYAGDAEVSGLTNNNSTGRCLPGTLSPEQVKGKIVLCLSGYEANVEKGSEVKRAGGVGIILENPENGIGISVDAHVVPGTAIFSNDSATILNYINTNKNPVAAIIPARTVLNSKPAPFMAAFSSAGPNGLEPNIIKPDITAPGLNILAAWSEGSSPTKLPDDHRVVKYNILSGTSMSCPHVAALAALVKSIHPDWSSAAIRSALMTTAGQNNNMGLPITDALGNPAMPFHYGAGHFQPVKAANPGLVYDANYTDYLLFLCNSGVNKLDPSFKCPKHFPSPSNLNYPSLAIARLSGTMTVKRTVTNVGSSKSVYTSTIKPPVGYSVEISPTVLHFSHLGEKKSFTVTVKAESGIKGEYAFGWYIWRDGFHVVRSPIAVSSA